MKDYIELFRRVVKVVRTDYVGSCASDRLNKTGELAQRLAMGVLEGFGGDTRWLNAVGLYLASTRDPLVTLEVGEGAAGLAPYSRGFAVRSCGDGLYVERLLGEGRLAVGDEVLELDGLAVGELLATYGAWIERDDPQARAWEPVVRASNRARIRHADGREETLSLKRFPVPAQAPQGRVGAVEPGAAGEGELVVRLGRLDDAAAVRDFIATHARELDGAPRLAFDLRDCSGLCEAAVQAVMPYLVARPTALSEYLETRYVRRFTADNCRIARAELEGLRRVLGADGDAAVWIDEECGELRAHEGAGDVELELEMDAALQEPVAPRGVAAQVRVLTDMRCSGGGELIALVAKDSPRACVEGRPTAGALGHFGVVRQEIAPGVAVAYPTCRHTDEALARLGTGTGIAPEKVLDWREG